MTDPEVLQIQQEKDHLKKAELMYLYRKKNNLTTTVLSKKLQMQAPYVCHYLRLLKLPSIVIDGYYGKLVSATHLYIIARLKDQESMMQAYEQVLERGLTSQQTETLIREMLYGLSSDDDRLTKDEINDYLQQFKTQYPGLRVNLVQTRVQGRLIFEIKGDTAKTSHTLLKLLNKLITDKGEVKRKSSKSLLSR